MELFSTWNVKCWNINSTFFKPQQVTCSYSMSKIFLSSRQLNTCLSGLCCLRALLGNRIVSEIWQGSSSFHNSPKKQRKEIMVLEEQEWVTEEMVRQFQLKHALTLLTTDCANFRSVSKIQCYFYWFCFLLREVSNVITLPGLSPAWNGEHRDGFE